MFVAADELAKQNLGFAYFMAKRKRWWARQVGYDLDDLDAEALVGLVEAAFEFDPSYGFTFGTFAGRVIHRHLSRVLSRFARLQLRQLPVDVDGEEMEFADKEGADPSDGLDVAHLLRPLPERTRLMLEMRFGLDGQGRRTLSELADRFGISRERVRQVLNAGMKTLRRNVREGVMSVAAPQQAGPALALVSRAPVLPSARPATATP